MKKVRSALTSVEGVEKAEVEMGKAMVVASDDVKAEDLIKAVEDAGFGAEEADS